MKSVTTQTVSIQADFEKAFKYISNPLNQKEWAINFIKDMRETSTGFIALTPFGETQVKFNADFETGVIDILLGDGKNPSCTRLIRNEEGCEYTFTLSKPNEMPKPVWQSQGIPGLIEELQTLKSILEKKLK